MSIHSPNKLTSLALSALLLALPAATASAATYNGNGSTGFGGGIGNGVLTITSTATDINFSLATSGFNGNGLAIYIDSIAGGVNSTSTFTDTADGGRVVLSGLNNNGRTLATFASGFGADFGIAVQPGNFAGIYDLSTPANFTFLAGAGLDTAATTTLNFSAPRSTLGLSPTAGFTFEASLISTSGYRSDETFGTSVTAIDPTNPGTAPNAGFTGTTTFSAVNTFGTPVPEPGTVAFLSVGAALLAGAGWRRARRTA